MRTDSQYKRDKYYPESHLFLKANKLKILVPTYYLLDTRLLAAKAAQ